MIIFLFKKNNIENFNDLLTLTADVATEAGMNTGDLVNTRTVKQIASNIDAPDARDVSRIAGRLDNVGDASLDIASNIDVNTRQIKNAQGALGDIDINSRQIGNVQDALGNIDVNTRQLGNVQNALGNIDVNTRQLNVDDSIVNRSIRSVDVGAPDMKKIDELQDQLKNLNKRFDELSEVDQLKFKKNFDDLDKKYIKLAKERPDEFDEVYTKIDDLISLKNKKHIEDDDIDFILKQIFNDDLDLEIDAKKKLKDIRKKYDNSLKCKTLGICSVKLDDIDDAVDKQYYKLSLKVREIFDKLTGANNLWKAATSTPSKKLALFMGLLISTLSIAFTGYVLAISNKGCKEDSDCNELDEGNKVHTCSKKKVNQLEDV